MKKIINKFLKYLEERGINFKYTSSDMYVSDYIDKNNFKFRFIIKISGDKIWVNVEFCKLFNNETFCRKYSLDKITDNNCCSLSRYWDKIADYMLEVVNMEDKLIYDVIEFEMDSFISHEFFKRFEKNLGIESSKFRFGKGIWIEFEDKDWYIRLSKRSVESDYEEEVFKIITQNKQFLKEVKMLVKEIRKLIKKIEKVNKSYITLKLI